MEKTRREFLRDGGSCLAAATVLGNLACRGEVAPTARQPNILFFFPDQHRFDWTGMNPRIPVPTPNLERLAARGVHFTNALCPSPLCAPARSCLASGKEYDRCGVPANRIDYPRDRTTYYRMLRDGGYHTMAVGKVDLSQGSGDFGNDGRMHMEPWGFSDMINNAGKMGGTMIYGARPADSLEPYFHYLDSQDPPLGKVHFDDMYFRATAEMAAPGLGVEPTPDLVQRLYGHVNHEHAMTFLKPSPLEERHYVDNWIARNGLELLDRAPSDTPWHLVVNFNGPHVPADITERMARLYRGPDRVIDGFPQPHGYTGAADAAAHLGARQNYSAMIENIDRWLGIYLDKLAERGELDNTIVVYSSDHGEMLGDHTLWGKFVPYHASVGVPLVMAGPGIRQGLTSDALVSIMDLAATFLDYGGLPIPDDMDSRSLRPLLESKTDSHRSHVLSGLGDWRLVYDGRHKLVEGFRGERLLYDLEEDAFEDANLAPDNSELCRRLGDLIQGGAEASSAVG
jgi:arylsulfatase A-like enzyme